MHVLLVENDPDTREVISLSLASAGHRVTETGNVNDALRLLRSYRDVQLVITDIHLGGRLSGMQLVEVMRQRRHMGPCILMSGDWDSLNQVCPENVSILRKPCGRDDLLKLVNGALAQQAPAAPPSSTLLLSEVTEASASLLHADIPPAA